MRPPATRDSDKAQDSMTAPRNTHPTENAHGIGPARHPRLISRRRLIGATLGAALATPVAIVTGYGYITKIEPGWVAIERVELKLPQLHLAFDGFRLVQLSDIDMDNWMTGERLRDVVRQTNDLKPDLIAITGDFVTEHPITSPLAALVPELRQIAAPSGIFAVLGNHDHWTDPAAVRVALGEANVTELRNTSRSIRRGEGILHLAGVDDYWMGEAKLDPFLDQLPPDAGAILLAHEPDFADLSAPTGRFALQLSGHSHGGQISLPLLGAPILPPFGRRYPRGRYQVGQMIQYSNRGLGMVQPYGRFNCRPEIALFTLRAGG